MYNFYEYFEIKNTSSVKEIINSYKIKIYPYQKLSELTDRQKYEIKMFKIGLYILTNKNLRKKYNKLIKLKNNNSININNKIQNSEIINNKQIEQLISKEDKFLNTSISNVEQQSSLEIINNTQSNAKIEQQQSQVIINNVQTDQQNSQLINTKNNITPNEHNSVYEFNLDNLFNIDNSWMNTMEQKKDDTKKNRIEPNQIGDRIFSLSQLNKTNYSGDFENELRKKTQCRNIDN